MRCWLYSHDGVGLGSLRRQLAIAAALEKLSPESRVLLSTSLSEASHFEAPANCEIIKLPAVRDRSLRTARLQEVAQTFRPDVLLVDKHPFGLGNELNVPIETVKRQGARLVWGLRDILGDRATVLREWLASETQKCIAKYYDRILIYGSAALFDPVKEYRFSSRLRDLAMFCGYVVNDGTRNVLTPAASTSGGSKRPLVMGTAGGGADGFNLLKVFIETAKGAPWRGSVVAGPFLEAHARQSLRRLALSNGVSFHRFDPELSLLFAQASVAVGMGGYNTLMETLSRGIPVICVPRTRPRSEQVLRAALFERQGLLRMIHPDDLTVNTLDAAISDALQVPRSHALARVDSLLQFDGARQTANQIANLSQGLD